MAFHAKVGVLVVMIPLGEIVVGAGGGDDEVRTVNVALAPHGVKPPGTFAITRHVYVPPSTRGNVTEGGPAEHVVAVQLSV